FNPIYKPMYYSNHHRNAYQSFETKNFRVYNKPYPNTIYPQQYYDQLNWFGFSFNSNKRQYDNYIKSLRLKNESKYDDSIKKGFVSGTVFDENGEPLPGVVVLVKGTSTGTSTDFDGNFSIQANPKDKLVFSYVGYISKEINIANNNSIIISLAEDVQHLDEVVTVGYASMRKSSLTDAVASVVTEELSDEDEIGMKLNEEVSEETIQKPNFDAVQIRK